MFKNINQFEFSEFLLKTVIGKGFDSFTGKKTLDSLQKYYSGDIGQIETVLDILSGDSVGSDVKDNMFLAILNINFILQEVNSEEFRCTANQSVGNWALISNILIPQLSCIYTDLVDGLNKSSPLKHLEFFLYHAKQGESPSYIAKKFLADKNNKVLNISEELNSIKKNSALTNKSINKLMRIIKEQIREKDIDSKYVFQLELNEIEAFLRCSRYLQAIHNNLNKLYSSNNIIEIYSYLSQCIEYAKVTNENEKFTNGLMLYPKMYIHWHKKLYCKLKSDYRTPLEAESIADLGVYKAFRDSMRSYLYKSPTLLLPMNLINPTKSVIGDIFSPWIKGTIWHRSAYPRTIAGQIIESLKENLDVMYYKSQLLLLSTSPDFEYHKHEYLYHQAIIELRERNYDNALNLLDSSLKICNKITAGETAVNCANLSIFINLLMKKKMNGGWYYKFMEVITSNIPNEVIQSFIFTDISNDEICFFKLSMIVNNYNNLNLLDSLGENITYDPMEKFYVLSKEIYNYFITYDDITKAIHLSLKGHNLCRLISHPIPFTFEMAIDNIFFLMKIYNLKSLPDQVECLINQTKEIKVALHNIRSTSQNKENINLSNKVNIERIASIHNINLLPI